MDDIYDCPNHHMRDDGTSSSCLHWSYMISDVMSDMQSVSGPKEVLKTFEVPQEMYSPEGEKIPLCPDCYQDMFEWHAQIFSGLKATKLLHSFFGE
jgi:hypothetical protein